MSSHVSEELPRLLTGEASRDVVLAAADHLRTCVDCQHELVSAVVAHSSLTSAHRFAPGILSGLFADNVADIGGAETDRGTETDPAADEHTDPNRPSGGNAEVALPDLSDVFAKVRREAAEPRSSALPSRRLSRSRYLVGAAAAAVLVGSGAVYLSTSNDNSGRSSATRTVPLAAFDTGNVPGEATIADGGALSINASSLPQIKGKRYEVWLTDDARTKMQPVGWLGVNGKAAMTVPTDLLSRYRDIEVSVQRVDSSSYKYSGTSVLRGSIS